MAWKENALGLVTKTAGWTNTNFDFVVAEAVESYGQPNPDLKPIELRCAELGIPMLALVKFNIDYYARQQYNMKEEAWPPFAQDYPLRAAVEAIANRKVYGVIVEVMNQKDHAQKTHQPGWISFASMMFCRKLSEWLALNKPGVQLFLGSSHQFISQYGGDASHNMNNWVGQYPSYICETRVLSDLVESYPKDGDKPNHLDNRPTRELWRYRPNLVIADRTPERLYAAIGFPAPTPPPVVTPPPGGGQPDPFVQLAEQVRILAETAGEAIQLIDELNTRVEELERRVDALTALAGDENAAIEDLRAWRAYVETLSFRQPEADAGAA